MRAVRLRHIPEERNQRFQCALQLAGNELEVRNCENSQQRRHNQQQSRNHPVGMTDGFTRIPRKAIWLSSCSTASFMTA